MSCWTISSTVLLIMHYGIHRVILLLLNCAHEITVFWLSVLMCTSEQIIASIRDTCRLESWSLFNGISREIFNFIRLQV